MVRLAHHERKEYCYNSMLYPLVLSLSKDVQQVFTQSDKGGYGKSGNLKVFHLTCAKRS